jgi:hypothetical protein
METVFVIIFIIVFILFCIRIGANLGNFIAKPLTTKTCPFCKSIIPRDAIVCKHCQREVGNEEKIQKKNTTEDYITQRELRIEAINKVIEKFNSKYPKVNFKYDETLGDVIITIPDLHPELKQQSESIKSEMMQELINFGVDAGSRFLSKDRIKTVGVLEGALEDTLAKQDRPQTNAKEKEIEETNNDIFKDVPINFTVNIKGPEDPKNLYLATKEFYKDAGVNFEKAKEFLIKGTTLNFENKDDALKIIDKYKQMGCYVNLENDST